MLSTAFLSNFDKYHDQEFRDQSQSANPCPGVRGAAHGMLVEEGSAKSGDWRGCLPANPRIWPNPPRPACREQLPGHLGKRLRIGSDLEILDHGNCRNSTETRLTAWAIAVADRGAWTFSMSTLLVRLPRQETRRKLSA